ncbi:unnamed protein product, partial [marine sediment metagenome]
AYENAQKFAFGLSDSEKAVISQETQELSKDLASSLQGQVDESPAEGGFDVGVFGGFFSRVPDVPAMMAADYRNSFGRFMTLTGGNAEQAQKLAYGSIKKVWGVTETGGPKRFSKYSPETIYSVPGSSNHWIEEQFNAEMVTAGAEGAVLAVDKGTARESQPSYPILVPNDDGILEPMRGDNGENLTWRPEYKLTDEYRKVSNAPGDAILNAKKQREVNQGKRANVVVNGIRTRVLNREFIPFNERADFLKSDQGKQWIDDAVNGMIESGRIDE